MRRRALVLLAAVLGSAASLGFTLDILRPELGEGPGLVGMICLFGAIYVLVKLGYT